MWFAHNDTLRKMVMATASNMKYSYITLGILDRPSVQEKCTNSVAFQLSDSFNDLGLLLIYDGV